MGKTKGSNAGPFSWIKGIKLKKTQHLDFTINENGFVKRINTIFFSRVQNKYYFFLTGANKQWG